jgi:two-component system, cell cycle sensor histidine kinase and response regulator CckA
VKQAFSPAPFGFDRRYKVFRLAADTSNSATAHSSTTHDFPLSELLMNNGILIVEDEGLIALDLQKKLQQVGYTVLGIADNSEDALRGVEDLRPSLVLMDIRLRGPQDGVAIADEIRRRFQVPVIFVTAHADRDTLDRARITEPFGYIVKPFHTIDFRAQIEIALWKHQMDQKLRVSEAWFSTTFQNVADALIATDEAGNIALMNGPASRLTGWEQAEAKGRPLGEVFRLAEENTGRPLTIDPSDAGHTAGPRTFNLERRDLNAPPVLVEAEFSANRDGGKTFGLIVAFRDITERRNAERLDRQLQKMNALSLMATGLGRELAESHSRMDDALKLLIERSEGETSRLLWDVYEHSAHQQSIVQQLILMGRTDAGRAVPVNLNEVLTGMREQLKKTLGVNRSLSLSLEPGIPAILADPRHLRENLLRLVADSRQATAKGGSVEISTMAIRTKDDKLSAQLVIQDDRKVAGAGARDRAFEPYYQSSQGKGNPGFSLALVSQFVVLSGGSIKVETSPEAGSAYLLSFPACVAPLPSGTSDEHTRAGRFHTGATNGIAAANGIAVATLA